METLLRLPSLIFGASCGWQGLYIIIIIIINNVGKDTNFKSLRAEQKDKDIKIERQNRARILLSRAKVLQLSWRGA